MHIFTEIFSHAIQLYILFTVPFIYMKKFV